MKTLIPILLLALISCSQIGALADRVSAPSEYIERNTASPGYKICAIGDTGTGGAGQYAVSGFLKSEGCDEVRILGDIIYPDGLESLDDIQYKTKFYFPYRDILKDTPFYLALGNHDWNKGKPDIWLEKSKEHKNVIFPHRYYADKYALKGGGSLCIITLALTNNHKNQKKFLKELKKKSADCKITISASHYPYLSVGKHGDAKFLIKKFLKDNIIGKVDLHLAGHDHHLSYEGDVKDTHLVVSGAAAKLRPLSDRRVAPYAVSKLGYVTVVIQEDSKVKLTFVTVNKEKKTKHVEYEKIFTAKGFR